jgi:hypothetical protein
MFNLVAFLPDERWWANLLRKIRWRRYNRITYILYGISKSVEKRASEVTVVSEQVAYAGCR